MYIFYSIFEKHCFVLKEFFFQRILSLCTEQCVIKSGLWWGVSNNSKLKSKLLIIKGTCADQSAQCTEMRFASFLSDGFITAIVVNPPERKLAKRTSVCLVAFLNNVRPCWIYSNYSFKNDDLSLWFIFLKIYISALWNVKLKMVSDTRFDWTFFFIYWTHIFLQPEGN